MSVLRTLLASGLYVVAGISHAATFTVVNGNDSGSGSLRAAIESANTTAAHDFITFNIPGPGPHAIFLASTLEILNPLTIDGYTQPGASANSAATGSNAQLKIVIDGSFTQPDRFGALRDVLFEAHYGSTLRGIAFVRGRGATIAISANSGDHTFTGNFVGLETDGVTPANSGNAFVIDGEFNRIGGTTRAERNLFVTRNAIQIGGSAAVRNVIRGNLFGTDRFEQPLTVAGNPTAITIYGGSGYNRVGAYSTDVPNVFANQFTAVALPASAGVGNEVAGNVYRGVTRPLDASWSGNDAFDADTGPNERMNTPQITRAVIDVIGDFAVDGQLHSLPNSEFRFALYAADSCAPGARIDYLGMVTGYSFADGNATLFWRSTLNPSGPLPRFVIATAGVDTAFVDNTSPMSNCLAVQQPPRPDFMFANSFD